LADVTDKPVSREELFKEEEGWAGPGPGRFAVLPRRFPRISALAGRRSPGTLWRPRAGFDKSVRLKPDWANRPHAISV